MAMAQIFDIKPRADGLNIASAVVQAFDAAPVSASTITRFEIADDADPFSSETVRRFELFEATPVHLDTSSEIAFELDGLRGAKGAKGDRGDAGVVPWHPAQEWLANFPYEAGPPAHVVVHGNGSYVCAVDHVSTTVFDPTKWIRLVSGDATGSLQSQIDATNQGLADLLNQVAIDIGQIMGQVASAETSIDNVRSDTLVAQQAVQDARTDLAAYDAILTADLNAARGDIVTFRGEASDARAAISARIDTVEAASGANAAAITTESISRATADTALAGRLDVVEASTASNAASITAEAAARVTEDDALARRIDEVEATAGPNAAAIAAEAAARAGADQSIAYQFSGLAAGQVEAELSAFDAAQTIAEAGLTHIVDTHEITASISRESIVRATATDALASDVSSLLVATGNNAAAIASESIARTNADEALGVRVTNVEASLGSANTSIAANASAISVATAQVGAVEAGLAAQASTLSTVQATVGQNTSAINVVQTAVDGHAARWSASTSQNGEMTGLISLDGQNTISIITLIASLLRIALTQGGTPVEVFKAGIVNGVSQLTINADVLMPDNAIVARHLSVATLSAIAANLGTITAGLLQSADGKFKVDLNAKLIEMTS